MSSIEINQYGTATRSDAFAAVGTKIDPASGDFLAQAGLAGWNVHLNPATTTLLQDDGVETVEIPGKFAIVRTDPGTGRLAAMGGVRTKSFVPVQNEELRDLLGAVTDQTGAQPSTAGQLNGGNRVFVAMDLPDTMTVGGVDPLGWQIVAFNSHDGSGAVKIAMTGTRLFCANQQKAILGAAGDGVFTIYHTKSAQAKIAEVREKLQLGFKYTEAFEVQAQKMIADQLRVDEFRVVVADLVGAVEGEGADKGAQKNRWAKVDAMTDLFTTADNLENVRGSAWAGYQAVTEYLDHYAPVEGKGDKQLVRATRVASGSLDSMKVKAFGAFAGV